MGAFPLELYAGTPVLSKAFVSVAIKPESTRHSFPLATELEEAEAAFEPRSVSAGSKDVKKLFLRTWSPGAEGALA